MADTQEGVLEVKDVLNEDKLIAALSAKLGPQLSELIAAGVQAKVKDLGLDRVDRKHIFTSMPDDEWGGVSKEAKIGAFLRAAIFGAHTPVEVKALSEGTTTAGGYLVPDDFRQSVIMRVNAMSVLYPRCFSFGTTLKSIKFPNLATDVEMSWDEAENANFDETDPVLGQTTFTIHRMNAVTYLSRELEEDSSPNVVGLVEKLFAQAVSRERDKMVAVGDGSAQPEGIFSATGITTVSSIGSITHAKLLEMDETITDEYRGSDQLCWISNQTVRRYCRSLTDENGRPLFDRPMERGAPYTMMDHPYVVNANCPSGYLALGDLNQYWIASRDEMGLETTTTGGDTFKKHQVGVKVWERWDGKLVLKTNCWVIGSGITGGYTGA